MVQKGRKMTISAQFPPNTFNPRSLINLEDNSLDDLLIQIFLYSVSELQDYKDLSAICKKWRVICETKVKPLLKSCFFSGKHKTRLLIGEGNFSFALALIDKHDFNARHSNQKSLGPFIVATELKDKIHCSDCETLEMFHSLDLSSSDNKDLKPILCDECSSTMARINALVAKGVQVKLGIDGIEAHNIEDFRIKRFSRIHWNCPHDGSNFRDQTLPKIIEKFFKSCAKLQRENGRVHVTLAQPNGKKFFYQVYVYDIVRAACAVGYTIIKKRIFSPSRYPGYKHTQTNSGLTASVTDEGMREFVFRKVKTEEKSAAFEAAKDQAGKVYPRALAQELQKLSGKKCRVNSETFYGNDSQLRQDRSYYICSSDSDSYDYED